MIFFQYFIPKYFSKAESEDVEDSEPDLLPDNDLSPHDDVITPDGINPDYFDQFDLDHVTDVEPTDLIELTKDDPINFEMKTPSVDVQKGCLGERLLLISGLRMYLIYYFKQIWDLRQKYCSG